MAERTLSKLGSMDLPNSTQSPRSVPTVPGSNQSHVDFTSVSSFFDEVLDKALTSASGDDSVQYRLFERTFELASRFIDSAKRCVRMRASAHNSNSWFLPSEVTIKVFSMIDKKSLMQAAACCTMFNKCAMDPLCYSHIDLSTSVDDANDEVVGTMIHRAGKELRSLKLGRVSRPEVYCVSDSLFTEYCLQPLAQNHGFFGLHLRSLRLYNLSVTTFSPLCHALSVCPNITDLRIVGLSDSSEELFKSLTGKCRFIEHLLLEKCCPSLIPESSLVEFVTNCPNLTSLTLKRFTLTDEIAQILAKSFHKLKYLNLSRSREINGCFLRDLAINCQDSPLETLILRGCPELKVKEILEFCNSLLTGNFKSIRHIDVSSNLGFGSDRDERCKKPKLPLERLKVERSDVTFVAEFPLTSSAKCYRVCDEEEMRLIEIMDAEDDEFDLKMIEENGCDRRMMDMMEAEAEAEAEQQLW